MDTTPIEEKIIADFCEAWNTLCPELLLRHLAPAFEYDSQWVMETLRLDDYASYLTGKFETLRQAEQKPAAQVVDDPICKYPPMLQITQGGRKVYYRIKVLDGQVVKGDLCMF